MPKTPTLIAACLVSSLAGQAWAQTSVPPDVQELERAHQADENERYAIPEKPRPNIAQKQTLHPARQVWVCMGADPWTQVYAAPNTSAPVIGLTQPQIALTGNPVNGFYTVLYYNGHRGYLPAAKTHPYHSSVSPGSTCSFAGLDDHEHPIFNFDLPPNR
jgi:hypothetical protein